MESRKFKRGDLISSPDKTYRAIVIRNTESIDLSTGAERLKLYVLHDEVCPYNKHQSGCVVVSTHDSWHIQRV
jgi:hypothetical protein